MEAGRNYEFEVLRKTTIGYMLKLDNEEIFMHNKETIGEPVEGQTIKAFLYYDSAKRLAATMADALISLDNPGWVKVENVLTNLGAFVNIGINKGMLISKEYLPYDEECWPNVGDMLFCILKNKSNRLSAKIVNNNEISNYVNVNENINIDDILMAKVTRINVEGVNLFTDNLSYIYIHKTQMRKKYHLGEEVQVRIISIDDRGIHGTLIDKKENMIDSDSEIVLDYLKKVKTIKENMTPEEIMSTFKMSKKAFKRAIGHLYKERIVDIKDNVISYIK